MVPTDYDGASQEDDIDGVEDEDDEEESETKEDDDIEAEQAVANGNCTFNFF